nr:hypothetical protein [Deinococcus cavernae]
MRKAQPVGTFSGLGSSPRMAGASLRWPGSSVGAAASSAWV